MPESFHNEAAQSPSPSAAAIDRGALRQLQEQLGGAGLSQLVSAFLERAPDRLTRLRAAAGEGDADKVREQAHSLKGTARSFGAAEMGEIAARIEHQAAAGSLGLAREMVAELADSFERTRAELEEQVAVSGGEAAAPADSEPGAARSIRVLLADDDAAARGLLSALLTTEPTLELVGAAEDADQAIELAAVAQPDVALLDLDMPGGGWRAIAEIRDRCPSTQSIALTALDAPEDQLQTRRSGAVDFLSKGASKQAIVAAVRSAVRWRPEHEEARASRPDPPASVETRVADLERRIASLERSVDRLLS